MISLNMAAVVPIHASNMTTLTPPPWMNRPGSRRPSSPIPESRELADLLLSGDHALQSPSMVIARAPVRVSFLGGGTDFPGHFEQHGGACLSTAIDRFAHVTVQPFLAEYFDHKIRLNYRRCESVNTTAEIQHPAIRAALEKLSLVENIEMHVMADMPARTGLGSSSSFVVAMLQALHAHLGRNRTWRELADEAIELERYILDEAGGWQDQIAAAHGGLSLIEFDTSGGYDVTPVLLDPQRRRDLERHMLLVYTGMERDSFTVQSAPAPVSDEQKTEVLKQLTQLALLGAERLTSDCPITEFGKLLHAGWELKKLTGAVTLPEIDDWYETGLEAGATGGKLLGAGQGGFLLFIAPPERHDAIRQALGNRPTTRIGIGAPGAEIIFRK